MTALPMGISIIIATHNRAESLRITLDSLTQVTLPSIPWELLVVQNACTDHTPEVIASFANQLPIVALDEPRLGQVYARHQGIRHSNYELKIFTDDDVIFSTNWLLAYERAVVEHPEAGYFGGPIHLKLPEDKVPAWAQDESGQMAVWIRNSLSYLDSSILRDRPSLFYGGNLAVRQCVFDQHGMYDDRLGHIGNKRLAGEETQLQARFKAAGVKGVYVPDALVYHRIRPDEITIKSRLAARLWMGRSRAKSNYIAGTQKRFNPRRTLGLIRFAVSLTLRWPTLPPYRRLEERGNLLMRWGYEYQMWSMLFSDRDLKTADENDR
jgi:glycosyltransferase involved in cell wall biosynthesis